MNEILRVEGLSKTFKLSRKQQQIERTDRKEIVAVDNLSFTANKGEIFGLLGPNGAGKTTTLRMLATLIAPDKGDAFIDGCSIVSQPEQVRAKIGFLTSELKLEDANLSTGMKQKTSLVVSLVHDPEFVIFDEPTNGLDVLTARTVTDYLLELREQGKTIILSTHIFSLVERLCDRVGIIIDGQMTHCDTLQGICGGLSLEDRFFDIYKEKKGGLE